MQDPVFGKLIRTILADCLDLFPLKPLKDAEFFHDLRLTINEFSGKMGSKIKVVGKEPMI